MPTQPCTRLLCNVHSSSVISLEFHSLTLHPPSSIWSISFPTSALAHRIWGIVWTWWIWPPTRHSVVFALQSLELHTGWQKLSVKTNILPLSLGQRGKIWYPVNFICLHFWFLQHTEFPRGKDLSPWFVYPMLGREHCSWQQKARKYLATLRSKRELTVPRVLEPRGWPWVSVWALALWEVICFTTMILCRMEPLCRALQDPVTGLMEVDVCLGPSAKIPSTTIYARVRVRVVCMCVCVRAHARGKGGTWGWNPRFPA